VLQISGSAFGSHAEGDQENSMQAAKRSFGLLALVATIQVFFVTEAWAYLDAGTGSFIFQMIVAAIVGVSVTLRMYWHRIKAFFSRQSPPAEEVAAEKAAGDNG